MSRVEYAAKLHQAGCNCAQSVACSFAEDLGVDESMLYKATEAFGGGMGCGKGMCGALAGAVVVCGMKNSDGNIAHPGATKAQSTKCAAMALKLFQERVGALICSDIKGGGTGAVLTSCADCIRIAVEITEEVLGL